MVSLKIVGCLRGKGDFYILQFKISLAKSVIFNNLLRNCDILKMNNCLNMLILLGSKFSL